MTTFVLVPGAGGDAFYWKWVAPELTRRGHEAIPVDLPGPDPTAGIIEYAELIAKAAAGRSDLVLVCQSMGGFSGPLACDRLDVRKLVLVNPMTPRPGETAGDWWTNTGQGEAYKQKAAEVGLDPEAPFDLMTGFFHDVPDDVTEQVFAYGAREEADIGFSQPWPLTAWPDVPTHVACGRDDRLFPLEFQRRVVGERLGLTVDEVPGGHLNAYSQPVALAERLIAYA
ncbi:alpha/beta fold hydrolase [Fodinicola acaciae]|uniref:alpha/beta fold hydrolase n=1 Tax=Fodinicola acaciae TaxID=2681555 RepID=UPI0013D088BA|nr:alpha/beta hydrolase [Fodinicola acaciae]